MLRLLSGLTILGLAACTNHAAPPEATPTEAAPPNTTVTIEDVLAAHTDSLMAVDGVTGVGQALCDGQPCLRIYVLARTPELDARLPDEVEGYPVELVETGQVRPRPIDGPR